MTTALYRRYRPETFAEVIGQEHVTGPLMQALRSGRVNHAYLFSGPRGCGKTTSARILARTLNCHANTPQTPLNTPCGVCPSCVELARGGSGSLDVVEIDAASHGGVDDARDLRERATFAPARDRYKIFIIDEAHMVSPAGFNALLKIVEEPPPHIKFVFATTEPDKVIGTIRSRTHHYPFRLVPPDVLSPYLESLCAAEGVTLGGGVVPLVVRAGGGSVRDSLSVLDQLIAGASSGTVDYDLAVGLLGYTHSSLLDDVVDALAARDGASLFRVVDQLIVSGHAPQRFVDDLLERLRDLIVIAVSGDAAGAVLRGQPADQLDRMAAQASRLGVAELSRAADLVNAALTEMTGATSPRLHLELLCARLLLPGSDEGTAGLAARIERLERGGLVAPASVAAPVRSGRQADDAGAAATGADAGGLRGAAAVRAAMQASRRPTAGAQAVATESAEAREPAPAAEPGPVPEVSSAVVTVPPQDDPVAEPAVESGAAGPVAEPVAAGAAAALAAHPVGAEPDAEPVVGQPVAGQPVAGQPVAGQPVAGQPVAGQPVAGQPVAGQPVAGQPVDDAPAEPPAEVALPAPASDAPAPDLAPADGVTTEVVRRRWREVLGSIQNPRAAAFLGEHAQVLSLEDGVLRLGFTPAVVAQARLGRPETISDAVYETLGVQVRVEIVAGSGGPRPRDAAPRRTEDDAAESDDPAPAALPAPSATTSLAPTLPAPTPATPAPPAAFDEADAAWLAGTAMYEPPSDDEPEPPAEDVEPEGASGWVASPSASPSPATSSTTQAIAAARASIAGSARASLGSAAAPVAGQAPAPGASATAAPRRESPVEAVQRHALQARAQGVSAPAAVPSSSAASPDPYDDAATDDPEIASTGLVGVPLVVKLLEGTIIDEQIDQG